MSIKSLFAVAVIALSSLMLSGCLDSGTAPYQPYHPDWTGSNGVGSMHGK